MHQNASTIHIMLPSGSLLSSCGLLYPLRHAAFMLPSPVMA
jgi:hypothetical protein